MSAPALVLGDETGIGGVGHPEAERGAYQVQRTHRAPLEQFRQPVSLRVVAIHERLHQNEPLTLGDVEGTRGLRLHPGERFLAEHVPAGLERPDRPLNMHRVRK
jgi:hypothetical protein